MSTLYSSPEFWLVRVVSMKFLHFCLCIADKVYWLSCVVLHLVHQLPFDEVLKPAIMNAAIHNCLNFPLVISIG